MSYGVSTPVTSCEINLYAFLYMNTSAKRRHLTFGDLVVEVFDHYGKVQARAILKLAVNVHLVRFCGPNQYVIN